MKKLLLILFSILFISCNNIHDKEIIPIEETGIYKIVYKEHDYLMFNITGYKAGVVHDPDCRKCKQLKDSL